MKRAKDKGEDWKARLKELGIARKRRKRRTGGTGDFLRGEEGEGGAGVGGGTLGEAAARASSPFEEIPRRSLRTLHKQMSGRGGEDRAALLLEENLLSVLARNVRYKDGELDIVADDAGTTVFVEVKRRRNAALGDPAEAVTRTKRARVVRAARRWLAAHPGRARRVRFDVVAVVDDPPSVTWIKDAFGREAGA